MKTITIKEIKWIDVPVMRNGKPTKRTKRIYEWVNKEVEMDCIEYQGHKIYYDPTRDNTTAYKENGEILTGDFLFGIYGKVIRPHCLCVNKKRQLSWNVNGYEGATGKGWGARLIKINW